MFTYVRLTLVMVLFSLGFAGAAFTQPKPDWQYPVISEAGPVVEVPNPVGVPDPNVEHRVIYSIAKPGKKPDKMNGGMKHVARLLNVFALANVPPENLKVTAIFHGPATPASLSDEKYMEIYGVPNPHTELIESLTAAGVEILVCAQAMASQGFELSEANPNLRPALSALTVVPLYQEAGYSLIQE